MDRAGVGRTFEAYRAERTRVWDRMTTGAGPLTPPASPAPRPSKLIGDRAALYLDLASRRRRALLMARRALALAAAQDSSNGSFHCAVRSSRAAEAAIGSTGASAA